MWFHVDDILKNKITNVYNGKMPPYFQTFEYNWCSMLSNNYKIILEEFEQFQKNDKLQPYFNKDQHGKSGKWKTLPLITWNIKRKHLKDFVKTNKLLQQIPGLVSASYSMLEKGGEIQEHFGDTDAHIRCHLCLYTSENAAFKVNNITVRWKEGECLIFCDACKHSGYNHGTKNRLIMILDILHQDNIVYTNKICAKVLTGLLLNYLIVLLDLKKKNSLVFILKLIYTPILLIMRIILKLRIVI